MDRILSVGELTSCIRGVLEGEELFRDIWVVGEISNYKAHSSGHHYFTLKDDKSSIRAVMWRSNALRLRFRPADGMRLLVRGSIGVYERDGNYQLYATQMQPDGLGELHLAFEQLKARLQEEGLFAQGRKRSLPQFPRNIVVLTSPTGAVIRDILNVLRRRYPQAQVLLIPVAVQGTLAAQSIVAAFEKMPQFPDTDVVILGRGGGSLEELWPFNEEMVARAIAGCPYPVVSAVGHETDFSIADLVADMRAPTPSAAAELIVPDRLELERKCANLGARLEREMERRLRERAQRLDDLSARLKSRSPQASVVERKKRLSDVERRLMTAFSAKMAGDRLRVAAQSGRLEALSPLGVLARGYSVTRRKDGMVVTDSGQLSIGEELVSYFRTGKVSSVVTEREN